MRQREELKHEEEQKKLAETAIELDPITLKRLILKLDNLERGLRELRKLHSSTKFTLSPHSIQAPFSISAIKVKP